MVRCIRGDHVGRRLDDNLYNVFGLFEKRMLDMFNTNSILAQLTTELMLTVDS